VKTVQARQPHQELITVLERWEGSVVAVRVIATGTDELVAVLTGHLRERSDEKHPALFWPVEPPEVPESERPGVYLHPDSYEAGRVHEGTSVVEFEQAGVTINIRRI
jgi:hypothetical protein